MKNEFKFSCPHCEQHMQAEVQFAGRQIECPACHHLINIPKPEAGTGFTQMPTEHGRTWDTFVPKDKPDA